MDLSTAERQLLAEAEAALPALLRNLYSDRLRAEAVVDQDGRRFFLLRDPAGKRVELRLDTAPLSQPLVARTFTNTTTDRYVVQLADTLPSEQVGQVLSREVGELLAVRDRAAISQRVPLENLLASGTVTPGHRELSHADMGRIGEFNYLATRMHDTGLTAPGREEARNRFSALVDELGLRPRASPEDTQSRAAEQRAAHLRLDVMRSRLRAEAREAMAELALPFELLSAADARALVEARSARATQEQVSSPLGTFPMPGLRPDGTPVRREELKQFAAAAAQRRTALSNRTLARLRAKQATLPEGRYPQLEIMIGGGAALTGRDPNVLLVDACGRWHIDPAEAIVQSAEQVRHLRQSGLGDPYQFADPQQRVPLPALQLWEDTAAARGPLIDGRAELSIGVGGRLIAEITPADGSDPVKVEVQGSPLVATGIPPEIIPGANRQVPTAREATDVLTEWLTTRGTAEAAAACEQLLATPETKGRAAKTLEVLAGPEVSDALGAAENTRVAAAIETLQATAAWEQARADAPGRVLMGDEIADGKCDPSIAKDWILAGAGGAAKANAEIILQGNQDARVVLVGKDPPFALHNDAQYTELRRTYDAEYGGDGRLAVYSGRYVGHYVGAIGTVTAPDGGVRLTALDSEGNPLGIDGDAYVACLGRIARPPQALASLESWARSSGGQVRGELMFDKDRQYLGYRLAFEAKGRQHTVDVTGAASRVLPANVFSSEDISRLAAFDSKTIPPESGNVAPGFMATALQGANLAKHRATERRSHDPAQTRPSAAAARARSTTSRKGPSPQEGPGATSRNSPGWPAHRPGPEGPKPRRGRGM